MQNRETKVIKALSSVCVFIFCILRIKLYDFQELIIKMLEENMKMNLGKDNRDVSYKKILVLKNRQSGFSYLFCCYILAMCMLTDDFTAVIVSYRESEAGLKIQTILEIYDTLPGIFKKKTRERNKRSIIFNTKDGKNIGSKIYSFGATSVRGISSNAQIFVLLDEAAFLPSAKEEEIYNSIYPLFTRAKAGSALAIVSTPFKKSGKFYDILMGKAGKGYTKIKINWWDMELLCKDVKNARVQALNYTTKERVYKFGTQRLIELFESMTLESFQQEFECKFQDFADSYFNIQEIQRNINAEIDYIEYNLLPTLEGNLFIGWDIARSKKDKSVIFIMEEKDGKLVARYQKTFLNTKFRDQKEFAYNLIFMLENKIKAMYIDKTGIGSMLAEELETDFSFCKGIHFTQNFKIEMVQYVKKRLEDNMYELVNDKETIMDFLKMKKIETKNGITFNADHGVDGHADNFISVGLCTYAYEDYIKEGESSFVYFGDVLNY